ncbi:tetratricopeptide repeat-containing sensor histidine kinase [Taibaiella chishuiensis]|uniref:tetratricopeptide repeat-containing sensor histidine kinase n=1 Tax=Taibaiella chishuiensis TaxID=1434707 RepID=UPI0015E7DBD7|nr:sensor histidine kinase [Taibaiella chishuiensis]
MNRPVCQVLRAVALLGLLLLCAAQQPYAQPVGERKPLQYTTMGDTTALLRVIEQANSLSASNRDSAIGLLRQALTRSEASAYVTGIRRGLNVLLPLLQDADKNQLLDRLESSCTQLQALQPALAVIYNARAKISQLKEQYELAGNYYMQAIPLARQYMPDYLATIYNNYAALLLNMPQDSLDHNKKSLYYLDKADEVARKYNDQKIITCVLCNKAKIYRNQGRYAESMRLAQAGLQLARQHHFAQWEYVLLNNIGDLYHLTGQYEKAIPYLEEAIANPNQPVDPYYRNMAIFTLGEVHLKLGHYKKAEQYFLESLAAARRYGIGRDLMEGSRKLAELYAAGKDYAQAYGYQLAYSNISDSLRNREVMDNVQRLEIKYRSAEKDKELLLSKLHIEQQAKSLHNKNTIILLSIALVLVLVLVTLALYSRFRQKQKILLREEQIREMQALMQGEEQERIRLAQDLHDGIGGMLAAVNMNMNVAEKKDFEDKAGLRVIMQMIEQTADEVRKTSHNLMPSALLRNNLKEALQYYCDNINRSGALFIDLDIHCDPDKIRTPYKTVVFRIVQELIQNILKHASATYAVVSLEQTRDTLNLIVEDNGLGFDLREKAMGFGLENLSYRVKGLGGSVDIRSEAEAGTSITVNLDMTTLN